MGQHAKNRVGDNTRSGTARPSSLRRQSLVKSNLQLATNPPAVPQHFCTAQKALARSSSTKSAGEVPKSIEMSAAHALVPTLPRLHNFTTSFHPTVDGSSSYPGNGSGPSCLPQTLHHLEEEKTTLKNMTKIIFKKSKQLSKKFKTNTKIQSIKKRKCTELFLVLPKFEVPSLKI